MPQPASAAMTCSTVETLTPVSLAMTVHSEAGVTASQRAGIRPSPRLWSMRWNQMPYSAAAGRMVSTAGAPVCSPMPLNVTGDLIVVCKSCLFSIPPVGRFPVLPGVHSPVTPFPVPLGVFPVPPDVPVPDMPPRLPDLTGAGRAPGTGRKGNGPPGSGPP